MTSEEKLIAMSEANRAAYLSSVLIPFLKDAKEVAIQKMKNLYVTGEYDESKLVACVAEICALDGLEIALKEKIMSGERIAKELNRGD